IEGDLNFIDAEGAVIGMLPGRPFLLAELLSGRHRFNQAGAFWRSSLTRRIGLMDEGLHYTMDHDYWARGALAGAQIVYVPGVRASFRLHEGSKTISQTEGFLRDWDALLARLQREHASDPAFVRMIEESRTASAWRNAVHFWREGKLNSVRPQLWRVLTRHPSLPRRAFSAALLLELSTGIRFSTLLPRGPGAVTSVKETPAAR
ncbi:MAG TPA: hypothetical protein VER79_03520, partial [Candidatus Limnocylindrales bacterium]|nr:hypothetical protein [Candidatus Limnocylindrales bacterium]